ncbi:hypothetical protein GCM10011504_58240 [Siccirubricoccus deserti]|nr:hypothetical protein GCM10011504_58240 [Siccirubricoccus deserti]
MDDDTTEPFGFPAIGRKKVAAAFDGGRLTSDGGVMLLAAAERQLGLCDRLAALIAEATCGTLRLALLRIGALVRRSVRRIKVAMASAHPHQAEFALAHARLTASAPA